MILTATAGTLNGLPAVQLATDAAPAYVIVDITRDPPGPAGALVRGTSRRLDAGGALAVTDVEAPFGQTITYTLTIRHENQPGESTQVTATADTAPSPAGAVLSDSFSGQWVGVTVVDETGRRATQTTAVYWPAGAARPVVRRAAARRWLLTLDIITTTAAQRDRLDELLTTGNPLLVRYPAGVELTGGWVQPLREVSVTRPEQPGTSPKARYAVEAATIDTPDPSVEATTVTLDDLHTLEPASLSALSAHAATLRALTLWAQDGVLDYAAGA